jgi:exonuclease III
MNITSFNVNGLRQDIKRKAIFSKLSKFNGISFIQETHCDLYSEKKWKSEWKGTLHFSNGSSNLRGVCIAIPDHVDCTILDKITDLDGRILILNTKINSEKIILCNIYSPTRDHKLDQINSYKKLKISYPNLNIIALY